MSQTCPVSRQSTPRPGSSPDDRKLDNLQILRALAALSVVVSHALHETESYGEQAGGWNFPFGVDVFFVISGFIMLHTSLGEFGGPGAPARFFLRRLSRIAPLYWLLTTLMIAGALVAPFMLNTPIGGWRHVLASYLFIPDVRGAGEIRPVLALGWTLNYEMMFYVLFSLALLAKPRFGLIWISAVMPLLVLYGLLAEPQNARIAFWTSPIILEFLFGIYAALAFRSGLRFGAGMSTALLAFGLVGYAPHAFTTGSWKEAAFCGVPALAMVLAAAAGPRFRLGRLTGWAVGLGNASYSLYLVHPFVLRPLRVLWLHAGGAHLPPAAFAGFASLASAAVAFALYRFVERPLTAFMQTRLTLARTAGAAGVRVALAMRRG